MTHAYLNECIEDYDIYYKKEKNDEYRPMDEKEIRTNLWYLLNKKRKRYYFL